MRRREFIRLFGGATALWTLGARKRVLVVNANFCSFRTYRPRSFMLTRATAPLHLAGAFNPRLCDVRVHCEVTDAPRAAIPPRRAPN